MYGRPLIAQRKNLILFAKGMFAIAALQLIGVVTNFFVQNPLIDKLFMISGMMISLAGLGVVFGAQMEARYWRWRAKNGWKFEDAKGNFTQDGQHMIVGFKWEALTPEVESWCRENCKSSFGVVPMMGSEVGIQKPSSIWFANGDDAFHFKMRWL